MDSSYNDSDSDLNYAESTTHSLDYEFDFRNLRMNDSKLKSNEDGFDHMPWVPTFKERVDKVIRRLLNDSMKFSMKFCAYQKLNSPPIIVISIPKVTMSA